LELSTALDETEPAAPEDGRTPVVRDGCTRLHGKVEMLRGNGYNAVRPINLAT
jgi:hypothetical protein